MVEGGTGSVRGSDSHESGLTRCREFLDPIFETIIINRFSGAHVLIVGSGS